MDAQWLQAWHWFALAIAIFIIEVFGVGGFFLGAGVAALVVGGTAWLIESLSWQWQIAVFACLTIAFTLIYYKRFKRFNLQSEQPNLNAGADAYVGREFTVLTKSVNGRAKIRIGDALWTVDVEAEEGDLVRIISVDGVLLKGVNLRDHKGAEKDNLL